MTPKCLRPECGVRWRSKDGAPCVTPACVRWDGTLVYETPPVDDLWLHASLRPPEALGPSATLGVRPEQLGLLSVLKASQTISSEIEFDQLVQRPRYESNRPFGMVPLRGRPLH